MSTPSDRCPACKSPSLYDQVSDRFFHLDGSDNKECWLILLRGDSADDSILVPLRCGHRQFMLDSWYFDRDAAAGMLSFVTGLEGVEPVGLVRKPTQVQWGALYISDRVHFSNHVADAKPIRWPEAERMMDGLK